MGGLYFLSARTGSDGKCVIWEIHFLKFNSSEINGNCTLVCMFFPKILLGCCLRAAVCCGLIPPRLLQSSVHSLLLQVADR